MLRQELKNTRVCLDFSFFAVIAVYLLLDDSGFGLAALGACALHECAHFIAMAAFRVPVEQLTFYGAGIRITSSAVGREKVHRRAVILSAGCAANFIAASAFYFTGNFLPAAANLFTGLFNLLPLGELDGAGLLNLIALRCCKPESVYKITRRAEILSGAVCVLAAAAAGGAVSFTLVTTGAYIVIVSSGRV